jgi:DNA-3-methyladenine glycosylase II
MNIPSSPSYWQDAITELSQADNLMGKIIARYPGEAMQSKDDAFHTLMRSITGQQISVKAADAIWGRLAGQISGCRIQGSGGKVADISTLNPESCILISDETLRTIGYSRQKISYIRSLCEYFATRQHLERDWAAMSDEEAIKDLTQIRGIGRWTAEMFLMFHLLRPNILPLDDIGLLNAIDHHYPAKEKRKKADYRAFAEKWQPWRSVATWYLWRTYDDEPVEY